MTVQPAAPLIESLLPKTSVFIRWSFFFYLTFWISANSSANVTTLRDTKSQAQPKRIYVGQLEQWPIELPDGIKFSQLDQPRVQPSSNGVVHLEPDKDNHSRLWISLIGVKPGPLTIQAVKLRNAQGHDQAIPARHFQVIAWPVQSSTQKNVVHGGAGELNGELKSLTDRVVAGKNFQFKLALHGPGALAIRQAPRLIIKKIAGTENEEFEVPAVENSLSWLATESTQIGQTWIYEWTATSPGQFRVAPLRVEHFMENRGLMTHLVTGLTLEVLPRPIHVISNDSLALRTDQSELNYKQRLVISAMAVIGGILATGFLLRMDKCRILRLKVKLIFSTLKKHDSHQALHIYRSLEPAWRKHKPQMSSTDLARFRELEKLAFQEKANNQCYLLD